MTSDSLEELNKQVLLGYLKSTKEMINLVLGKYNLTYHDKIQQLVREAGRMVSDFYVAKSTARKKIDTVSYFVNDLNHEHYNHLLYTIIPFVMTQDYIEYDCNISALLAAIEGRIDDFDKYWDDMEKGIIKKRPLLDD